MKDDIELILFRGLPGSGKTTLGDALCDTLLSADDYFTDNEGNYSFDPTKIKAAHLWCIEATRSWIRSANCGTTIGVANTFTQEWEMEPYFKLAAEYGIRIHTVIVENRHDSINTHGVPDEVVSRMRARFEVVL